MVTILCCGRQKPLGTHGNSSSQEPRGSRLPRRLPRWHGPFAERAAVTQAPGPSDPTGWQRREHPAEAGSAQRALFWAVWHDRPPRLPDTKSRLCFCLVSGPEFNYLLHGLFSRESLRCCFHLPGSVDLTSPCGGGEEDGRGEVREGPSCLHLLLSPPCSVSTGI